MHAILKPDNKFIFQSKQLT